MLWRPGDLAYVQRERKVQLTVVILYDNGFFQNCFGLRFMVAGVFSRCMLVKHLNSHYRVETDCCHDPAVYERINEEIKHWIWKKAPGVRDSRGCPKKEVKSMIKNPVFNTNGFKF